MLGVSSIVLGATPIKTKSRRAIRKRLYATPAPDPPATPPAQVQSTPLSTDSRAGTLVKHNPVEGNPRSGQLGVVVKRTSDTAETLDILWTTDGATTQTLPSLLTADTKSPQPVRETKTADDSESVYSREKSFYDNLSSKGYKNLLPHKFPKDLRCPLDSVDTTVVETFKFQLDNHLFSGHPNIRKVITGEMEPPLLTYEPYLNYMRDKCKPDKFVFNHATVDNDIASMRASNNHQLAKECEIVSDNPPLFDGFRPCNNAIYFATLKTIHQDDIYIMRNVIYGDGIGLRNLLWDSMSGDEVRSKKLMAMSSTADITQVKYRFVRHGVKKYFTEIHKVLSKLESLGAKKQDWEIFGAIFVHMEQQCEGLL